MEKKAITISREVKIWIGVLFVIFAVLGLAIIATRKPPTETPTQEKPKTRIEYTVEVTTSDPHYGAITVSDENDTQISLKYFNGTDEATVTKEYKISAGVNDTVTVEARCPGGMVTVRLVKEGAIIDKTIASKVDFDGILFRYTIKEDDI